MHTVCEICLARWGQSAHITYITFVLITMREFATMPPRRRSCRLAANRSLRRRSLAVIVTAMLILGGAAVVTALSGMNIYAASFLIPISAVPFTMHGPRQPRPLPSHDTRTITFPVPPIPFPGCSLRQRRDSPNRLPAGGLQATYISAWAHVAIIYIAMLIFLWKVYAGPSELGSTDKVWDNLQIAAEKNPVEWNIKGSYLTIWSTQGELPHRPGPLALRPERGTLPALPALPALRAKAVICSLRGPRPLQTWTRRFLFCIVARCPSSPASKPCHPSLSAGGRDHLRHHQHHWQLRHRLLRPVLLAGERALRRPALARPRAGRSRPCCKLRAIRVIVRRATLR